MRLLLLLSICALGFSSEDGEQLYKHLLDHEFLKLELPKKEMDPVAVNLGMTATKIDIDKETNEMWLHSWLEIKWQDYRMTWDPEDYGNRTDVRLPLEKIWIPDIRLYNGETESDELSCFLKFGSWTYHGFDVDLTAGNVDLSFYTVNEQWSIEKATASLRTVRYTCCPEPYPEIRFTFVLKK